MTGKKNRSGASAGLAVKLTLVVFFAAGLVFLGVVAYDYTFSRRYVIETTDTHAANLARSAVDEIEKKLARIQAAAETVSLAAVHGAGTEEKSRNLIIDTLKANADIFSFAVVVDDGDQKGFAPYYYRRDNKLAYADLARSDYDYREKTWYQEPARTGAPCWTEPYVPTGGSHELMCSYSVPIYRESRGKKAFSGVVTADIGLDWLTRILSSLQYTRSGYAFLVSADGTFISHPQKEYRINQSLFSVAEITGNADLADIGREMTQGRQGSRRYHSPFLEKEVWIFYAPFDSNQWSLGLVIPHDELFEEVRRQSVKLFSAATAGIFLLAVVIMAVVRKLTRPIQDLVQSSAAISRGDLDTPLAPARSGDEIGRLTTDFENMRRSLKEYIQNLKETTAAREKIEGELKIAHRIQMSFLPQQSQLGPFREEFELSATMEPAREVGGDLYDFFLMDTDHLFFAIGDVSDKGVPAALFMAVTKTLIKGMAGTGRTPSDILARVNAELCRDNASMMFVTLCCGILDLNTGELQYSNAGHNPPVLFFPGRRPQWLSLPPGLVLGAAEEAQYETRSMLLPPGAMLLLYTDGVTEAMDEDLSLYGENRLMQIAADATKHRPDRLIERVFNDVHRHSGNAAQSDDITLLAVCYNGIPARKPATDKNLDKEFNKEKS